MKLRELINRLEELSENGKNDELTVHVFEPYYVGEDEGIGRFHVACRVKRHEDVIRIIV